MDRQRVAAVCTTSRGYSRGEAGGEVYYTRHIYIYQSERETEIEEAGMARVSRRVEEGRGRRARGRRDREGRRREKGGGGGRRGEALGRYGKLLSTG